MQEDFHFYTIYTLCRCAGMSGADSHTVAYASQHTDDAKYEHALEFENGGRFQQVLTSHRFFHPDAISKDVCYRIWVPFHHNSHQEAHTFKGGRNGGHADLL